MLGAMLGCFPERLYAKSAEAVFIPELRDGVKLMGVNSFTLLPGDADHAAV